MAIAELPPASFFEFPSMLKLSAGTPVYGSGVIDASTEKFAYIIQVPKTGTIDTIEMEFRAISMNAGSVVRISFQDVDLATGDADGVQDQFRDLTTDPTSNAWYSTVGLITSDGTDGGTKRSVTVGDKLAVVIEYQTFTAADSIVPGVVAGSAIPSNQGVLPYSSLFTGTWAKGANLPCLALKYDDGNYYIPYGCMPASALNTRTFNNGSTPDERGVLFNLPFPVRVCGIAIRVDLDGDADVVLYEGTTARLTLSLDKDVRINTNSSTMYRFFGSTFDLAANTDYRLVLKPTSATNLIFYDYDVNAAAILANNIAAKWYSTNRTDAGSFSDVNTNVPHLFLLVNGFDNAASGGTNRAALPSGVSVVG